MIRSAVTMLLSIALCLTGIGLFVAVFLAVPANAASSGLPRAVAEDHCATGVSRCVWDGRHQGNGTGRSYIIAGDTVHYVSHARAHRLNARYCDRPQVACH